MRSTNWSKIGRKQAYGTRVNWSSLLPNHITFLFYKQCVSRDEQKKRIGETVFIVIMLLSLLLLLLKKGRGEGNESFPRLKRFVFVKEEQEIGETALLSCYFEEQRGIIAIIKHSTCTCRCSSIATLVLPEPEGPSSIAKRVPCWEVSRSEDSPLSTCPRP